MTWTSHTVWIICEKSIVSLFHSKIFLNCPGFAGAVQKVLFVWDCDATVKVTSTKNTYAFVLPLNQLNNIAKKGIENMFPEHLFGDFTTKITKSQGEIISNFDEKRKKDFEKLILSRNDINDFTNFPCLVEEITGIKNNGYSSQN